LPDGRAASDLDLMEESMMSVTKSLMRETCRKQPWQFISQPTHGNRKVRRFFLQSTKKRVQRFKV